MLLRTSSTVSSLVPHKAAKSLLFDPEPEIETIPHPEYRLPLMCIHYYNPYIQKNVTI